MLGRGLESLIPPQKDKGSKANNNGPIDEPQNNSSPSGYREEPKVSESSISSDDAKNKESKPGEEAKPSGRQPYSPPGSKHLSESIFHIEVEKIKPNPLQPRRVFDDESLKELAASIREYGILQPLVVSKIEKETDTGTEVEYQLIAGERRLMAAKMLGWERVPAIIKRVDQQSERLEMAVIENIQRADLNAIETARAYAKLQDEFRLTQREIASRMGKSREAVANSLRLLNLPTEIQDALAKNVINESQARLFLAVPDLIEQQKLFRELMSRNLSVRELKHRIRKPVPDALVEPVQSGAEDPEIFSLEEKLTEFLGTKVKIEKTEKGGKIIINFYSPEEIEGIIEKINPHAKDE